jgi:hypothetical protein
VLRLAMREDALAWIAANQLGRRNLTPSQKAALALELEKQLAAEAKKRIRLSNASKEKIADSDKGQARDKAAAMVGANPHYVSDAKKIEQDAPEILEQVKQGTLSIPQAKKVAALLAENRPAAIERIHKRETEEGGSATDYESVGQRFKPSRATQSRSKSESGIGFKVGKTVSKRSEEEGSGAEIDFTKN